METFKIKHRFSDRVLFRLETKSLKLCVEAAVEAGAYLTGAYLAEAYLTGAYLAGANLAEANLTGAYLAGAYLAEANLTGANLTGANLAEANLTGAKGINPHCCTPLLMLYDQPGPIRLYKLVNSEGEGPFNGGIKYDIGQEYAVKDANADIDTQCGAGINLATLDWCLKRWRDGYRILIAEFEVKDIAAIPTATDGKIRVHRCKIVGEKNCNTLRLIYKEEADAD